MTHIDLIEYDDGIHVRVTPRQPLPSSQFYPGDVVRCPHQTPGLPGRPGEPVLYDKHKLGHRLTYNPINGIDLTRGCADGPAPRCGCWLPIAQGSLIPAPKMMVTAREG